MAAYTLGVPVVIHEANVEPGMANRMLERFATLICVGRPEAASHFRRPVLVTGVPAGNIVRSRPPEGPPWRFLVLGGSEGSPALNEQAPLLFAELRRKGVVFAVHHLCGFADPAPIERAYAAAGVAAQVDGFVDSNSLYAGAALALTSAGARHVGGTSCGRRALTAYSARWRPPATTRLPTRGFTLRAPAPA